MCLGTIKSIGEIVKENLPYYKEKLEKIECSC